MGSQNFPNENIETAYYYKKYNYQEFNADRIESSVSSMKA